MGNFEKPLITRFELLNLGPATSTVTGSKYEEKSFDQHTDKPSTKWRRVGLISGQNVQLDTIVWPGGDILVSGLSAKSRTIFRIVTALAPPFVMEKDLEDGGMCLRGILCYQVFTSGRDNLTNIFNKIEMNDRLKEDENQGKKKGYVEEGDRDKLSSRYLIIS